MTENGASVDILTEAAAQATQITAHPAKRQRGGLMGLEGVGKRLATAAGWTLAGHALTQLVRFGSNLVLTRLLAPEMFGVMAVAYMIFTGLNMFSDVGTSAIISQNQRGNTPRFLNVVWVVQIARGVVITAGAIAFGLVLAGMSDARWIPATSAYSDSRMPGVLLVMSIYGLASGFESTKSALARRNLDFSRITKIEVLVQLATTVVILTWAFLSPTIWALIAGWIFSALLKTILTHTSLEGPTNHFSWNWSDFQEVFAFGKWVLVSSFISFLLICSDRILLGIYLDSQLLGLYSIAVLLVAALQDAVLRVNGLAVMPALSELVRDNAQDLKEKFYRIRRPLDIASGIPAGLLCALAVPIIDLLYDSRYRQSGPMLAMLAIGLLPTSLNVLEQLLIAKGQTRTLSGINLLRLIVVYSLVPIGEAIGGPMWAVGALPAAALVNGGIALWFQSRMGLFRFRSEVMIFVYFCFGWSFGAALIKLVELYR